MWFRLALLMFAIAFAAIYLPDLGHGFIRDDFGWIESSLVASPGDLVRLFTQQPGFYRPIVSLTFSVDQAIWQLNPFGYALTNLILFAIVAGLMYRLTRTLALPAGAALLAVGVWAFDIHAPRMALLWISGRTALLLCVFALAATDATLRGRRYMAGILCLFALLSKEEAVLLPAILTAFMWIDRQEKIGALLKTAWPVWAALAIYVVLRINSGAFGPSNLPAHYPVVADAAALIRNVGEYAVRAGLIGAIVAVVLTIVVRPSLPFQQAERRVVVLGGLWLIGFFGITIVAANRSDLYALAPSIGCALVVAALASSALRSNPLRFRLVCTGLVVAVIALVPVYWQRDRRWVEPADVSAYVVETLRRETGAGAEGRIVLVDDVSMRYGLESAFGTLLPEATRLLKGDGWSGELRRTRESCLGAGSDANAVVFVFRAGQLTRCR